MSDVIDRWSILRMKVKYAPQVQKELDLYELDVKRVLDDLTDATSTWFEVVSHLTTLAQCNAKIWEHEAAIRKEFDNDPSATNELSLTEIGRRALLIRQFNGLRNEAKSKIDNFFGEESEPKVNHISV